MNNDNRVTCPNCGKTHEITSSTKSCCWETLDGMMAIATITASLLVGLAMVIILKCVDWFGFFTPPTALILTTAIVSIVVTFPIVANFMVRYQKDSLESLGVCMYRISCDCRTENTFTIIRPIVVKQEEMLITEIFQDYE